MRCSVADTNASPRSVTDAPKSSSGVYATGRRDLLCCVRTLDERMSSNSHVMHTSSEVVVHTGGHGVYATHIM